MTFVSAGFNVPFCRKPTRFAQAYISRICNQIKAVATVIDSGDYQFVHRDFSKTIATAKAGDIIYADPPYIDRHSDYFNAWGRRRKPGWLHCSGNPKLIHPFHWHSNDFRSNTYIASHWSQYHLLTRVHCYHVGGSEDNRNPMLEALITNFIPECLSQMPK